MLGKVTYNMAKGKLDLGKHFDNFFPHDIPALPKLSGQLSDTSECLLILSVNLGVFINMTTCANNLWEIPVFDTKM